MLQDDRYAFYLIWCTIELFHLITPVSLAITLLYIIGYQPYRAPVFIEYFAMIESGFYLCFFLPRRALLNRLPPAITTRSREERRRLFRQCLDSVPDVCQWLSIWFKEAEAAQLGRGDVKVFLAWGFLNKATVDDADTEELEEYMSEIENICGLGFATSDTGLLPCRVSVDIMNLRHKSLTFYLVSTRDINFRHELTKAAHRRYDGPDLPYSTFSVIVATLSATNRLYSQCMAAATDDGVVARCLSVFEHVLLASVAHMQHPATHSVHPWHRPRDQYVLKVPAGAGK